MAYMSQERKKELAPKIKEICRRFGVSASLGVRHHSTLVLTIKSGKIDFLESYNRVCSQKAYHPNQPFQPVETYMDVNPYWYREHFDGRALEFLNELLPAMNAGNWDKSDIQTDYFNVGWYSDVKIGRWDQPYQFLAS